MLGALGPAPSLVLALPGCMALHESLPFYRPQFHLWVNWRASSQLPTHDCITTGILRAKPSTASLWGRTFPGCPRSSDNLSPVRPQRPPALQPDGMEKCMEGRQEEK